MPRHYVIYPDSYEPVEYGAQVTHENEVFHFCRGPDRVYQMSLTVIDVILQVGNHESTKVLQ